MSALGHLNNLASLALLDGDEELSISTSISYLERNLNSYFQGKLSGHCIFGSYTRGTILTRKMDENSDIDYMVVFEDNSFQPQTYLTRLKTFAENYYPNSIHSQSNPAIVLELNHIKFDLVPAVDNGLLYQSLHIPAKASAWNNWIETNPNDFNNSLILKNTNNYSLIKPLIRVVKYWNSINGSPFESYGLEKTIVDFNFNGTPANLLHYFYKFMMSLYCTWDAPQWKKDKVGIMQKILANVAWYQDNAQPYNAEVELKKLLPGI